MPSKSFSLLKNDNRIEFIIGILSLINYTGTLFFPLLDKDAAHHANIALHMYQTGDYFSLVDRGKDYLDKPHFLFWTTLFFFKIFGINTVAHRLPALLFALLSVYSTYKLSRHLTGRITARIAAIVIATAQAFILSISDARMETPLTAGMILGLWQLIVYIDKSKFINLIFGMLGIAIAFSTKGWLGPVIVFIALFFYILLNKKWQIFTQFKTWLFIPLFFVFIGPVLYAYYLQYDLHPEKVIRGRDHISGVEFILWGQLFERYKGFDEGGRYSDPFFLYHTFLWAFFPWCIVAYIAVIYWFRRMFWLKKWKHPVNFAALAFVFVLVTLSFSKFKMPHYLIMLFPLATIFTAPYLRHILSFRKGINLFLPIQSLFIALFPLAAIALNFYFLKPASWVIYLCSAILLGFIFWLILNRSLQKEMKIFYLSAVVSLFFNFLLYYNFFPQLLTYQGGNEMAKQIKEKNIQIPDEHIQLLEDNAHSFDFYRGYIHPTVTIEKLQKDSAITKDNYFLLNKRQRDELQKLGFRIQPVVIQKDYNVAKVSLKFLNPDTRVKRLDTLTLAKIYKE
jgi:4-amino-4-deoxy-L-arabinose transferase-like glycosyltransferase